MKGTIALPPGKPLSPAALKVLAAIRVKAGASGVALHPTGGWPRYCGVSARTFSLVMKQGLPGIERITDPPKIIFHVSESPASHFARIDERALALPPGAFRVLVGLTTYANAEGLAWAANAVVANRCGLTASGVQKQYLILKSRRLFRRHGGNLWEIPNGGEDLKFCQISFSDLKNFGFQFSRPGPCVTLPDPGNFGLVWDDEEQCCMGAITRQ